MPKSQSARAAAPTVAISPKLAIRAVKSPPVTLERSDALLVWGFRHLRVKSVHWGSRFSSKGWAPAQQRLRACAERSIVDGLAAGVRREGPDPTSPAPFEENLTAARCLRMDASVGAQHIGLCFFEDRQTGSRKTTYAWPCFRRSISRMARCDTKTSRPLALEALTCARAQNLGVPKSHSPDSQRLYSLRRRRR